MGKRIGDLAIGAVFGAVAGWAARDRLRDTLERSGKAVGARHYATAPDDATLARKVETELFGRSSVPREKIQVNVHDGVVQLSGEVPEPNLVQDLVERARGVDGVRRVENFLHVSDTEPQMHQ